MNRTLGARMSKLETRHNGAPVAPRAVHSIISDSDAEADEAMAARIAAGTAQASDLFIVNLVVDPCATWRAA